jgi:hypothetical protein
MRPKGWEVGKPLRVWLNPSHGPALRSLGYELIWCTTWENDANTWIGPHVGLPKLEYVTFGPRGEDRNSKLFWKTQHIASYMLKKYPGRDFIVVDDEIKEKDLDYLRDYCPVNIEIFPINPSKGLDSDDFDKIREWKGERDSGEYAN